VHDAFFDIKNAARPYATIEALVYAVDYLHRPIFAANLFLTTFGGNRLPLVSLSQWATVSGLISPRAFIA
jgi:hypothetical protein